MLTIPLMVLAMVSVPMAQEPQVEVPRADAQTVQAGSSPVRAITARPAPRGDTRTVCSWERATGSTMNRRVCREVATHSGQRDRTDEDSLRRMQGSTWSETRSRSGAGRPIG